TVMPPPSGSDSTIVVSPTGSPARNANETEPAEPGPLSFRSACRATSPNHALSAAAARSTRFASALRIHRATSVGPAPSPTLNAIVRYSTGLGPPRRTAHPATTIATVHAKALFMIPLRVGMTVTDAPGDRS